eukprot:1364499-Rhodomonas_salina.3
MSLEGWMQRQRETRLRGRSGWSSVAARATLALSSASTLLRREPLSQHDDRSRAVGAGHRQFKLHKNCTLLRMPRACELQNEYNQVD